MEGEKQSFHLVGSPFLVLKGFSSMHMKEGT